MANKRKYPEVQGWWVYTIYVPSIAKYYIGVSHQKCYLRWHKSSYKGKSLEPYLNEWQDMIKTVIKDNLSKEEALKKEDELIQELQMNDLCINKQRSGLIEVTDKNAYARELYQNNPEYRERKKERRLKYYENNKEQEKQRVKQYRENNKEKIREKRRQRYLKKKLQQQQNQLTLFDLAS